MLKCSHPVDRELQLQEFNQHLVEVTAREMQRQKHCSLSKNEIKAKSFFSLPKPFINWIYHYNFFYCL